MDRGAQSDRLLQAGTSLILVAVLVGLGVPRFAVPRVALSAHLVGILQGLLLIVLGLLWSRLNLTRSQCLIAFWLTSYQAVAAFFANVFAAMWGAGNSIIPMAAGTAHGSRAQEAIITIGLRSAGAALIAALLLLLWGLRRAPGEER